MGVAARPFAYARRYALFALVGIAGEDDLDASDFGAPANPAAEPPRRDDRLRSTGQAAAAQRSAPGDGKLPGHSARSLLGAQLSASLRESLIAQMAAINSPDEATAWAHRNLPAKNTLTAADAKIVEERFQARLSAIGDAWVTAGTSDGPAPGGSPDGLAPNHPPQADADQAVKSIGRPKAGGRQKTAAVKAEGSLSISVHSLGRPVRLRDKDHRKFVMQQSCLVCGRVPSDAHHLTFTQPRALGRRVSDEFVVPVCRTHHRELHRSGNEAAWWQRLNIDPIPVALRLWQQTRSDDPTSPEARIESKASTQGEAPDRASQPPA